MKTEVGPTEPSRRITRGHPGVVNGKRVMVVLPAYNAARTLERTVAEIPAGVVDDILLVDDASRDETVDAGAAAGDPRGRPSPQPGLRRQPEDLLHRGAAPRAPRSWSCSTPTTSTRPG